MLFELTPLGIVLVLGFPAAMAFSAASDLFTMRISNRVSLALLAGFLVLAPLVGMSLESFGLHLAAGVTMLAIGFLGFSFGLMGGADAKVAAAVALWFGPMGAIEFLLIASIFGGGLTLAVLILRKAPLPRTVGEIEWVQRLANPGNGVPYGIALAASALVIYPNTLWMAAAFQ